MYSSNGYASRSLLRPILLLLPAFILAILEVWHPVGFSKDVYNLLLPQANWWFLLHLYQIPLFGLMGVAGMLLLAGKHGVTVRCSQIGFWIFMIFYTAFDSIAGVSIGALLLDSQNMPASKQVVIAEAIQKLFQHPIVGGSHSLLSETASLGWVMGMVPAFIVLARNNAPAVTLIMFAISAISLWWSRAYPFGPIAFTAFFIGALFLLISERKRRLSSAVSRKYV